MALEHDRAVASVISGCCGGGTTISRRQTDHGVFGKPTTHQAANRPRTKRQTDQTQTGKPTTRILPIKARVDDSDRPGQYLLTGSARLMDLRSRVQHPDQPTSSPTGTARTDRHRQDRQDRQDRQMACFCQVGVFWCTKTRQHDRNTPTRPEDAFTGESRWCRRGPSPRARRTPQPLRRRMKSNT